MNISCVVAKDTLLEIVRENKKRHEKLHRDALAGWREEMKQMLEKALSTVAADPPHGVYINEEPPMDHTQDYDRVIEMLELTEEDVIDLNGNDFAALVRDDWSWTVVWVQSNRKFSSAVHQYGQSKRI